MRGRKTLLPGLKALCRDKSGVCWLCVRTVLPESVTEAEDDMSAEEERQIQLCLVERKKRNCPLWTRVWGMQSVTTLTAVANQRAGVCYGVQRYRPSGNNKASKGDGVEHWKHRERM